MPGALTRRDLRRFYRVRLPAEPQASIERYVQDGIKRHREQVGAYLFAHRGRQLRVACVAQPNGDRVRVWQDFSAMESVLLNLAGKQDSALPQGVGPTAQQALRMFDQLSDGIAVHDEQGRIIFANDRFLAIYGLRTQEDAWGKTLEDIVRLHWARAEEEVSPQLLFDMQAALQDGIHFLGIPFEVPLAGHRLGARYLERGPGQAVVQLACGRHAGKAGDFRDGAAQQKALAGEPPRLPHRPVEPPRAVAFAAAGHRYAGRARLAVHRPGWLQTGQRHGRPCPGRCRLVPDGCGVAGLCAQR